MFPERIETDRLVLDALTHENVDVLDYYEICSSDPDIDEVTEYLNWDPHETVNETLQFIDAMEENRVEGKGAEFVVRPKDSEDDAGEIAGATGLNVDWARRTGELGMWLRKRFWGRGYSGERAAALMDLAFETLDLEVVAVTHRDGNEKSRRAVEKYVDDHGGQYDGILRNWDTSGDDPADVHRYTVLREQYEDATS